MFNGDELLGCLKLAAYCTVNDYEAQPALRTYRAFSIESLADEVRKRLIVTRGGEGSDDPHRRPQRSSIPCVTPCQR
jgi:adenosine kinase